MIDFAFATKQERILWALAHFDDISKRVRNIDEVSPDTYLVAYVRISRRVAETWNPEGLCFDGFMVSALQNEIQFLVHRNQRETAAEKAERMVAEAEEAWAQLEEGHEDV